MYRVNPLLRNVLIMADEVIFHAPTLHTLDPRTIEQGIIIAEERFVRPALGDLFYDDICNEKNTIVTNGNKITLEAQINASLPEGSDNISLNIGDIVNAMEFLDPDYLSLWKKYLWKLTAECVMLTATPEAWVQFGSEGVIHKAPQAGSIAASGISSPDLKSVKWAMDKKMMDRVDPLRAAMHNFFCRNITTYPLYTKPCDCNEDGVAYKRKTDWVTGLYDDIDNPNPSNCCDD